jgi:hypothetical protein
VAVKLATHVNYAQQTERNAANAQQLEISQESATPKKNAKPNQTGCIKFKSNSPARFEGIEESDFV